MKALVGRVVFALVVTGLMLAGLGWSLAWPGRRVVRRRVRLIRTRAGPEFVLPALG